MAISDPERGDIIVYKKTKTVPKERMETYTTVVEVVEDDHVYCGNDGWVPRENIVSINGQSPDYDAEADEFHTTGN